jgi:hypothetical protein
VGASTAKDGRETSADGIEFMDATHEAMTTRDQADSILKNLECPAEVTSL